MKCCGTTPTNQPDGTQPTSGEIPDLPSVGRLESILATIKRVITCLRQRWTTRAVSTTALPRVQDEWLKELPHSNNEVKGDEDDYN